LQHPGIAQIYEAGTLDTGFGPQPYFAMELVRGLPISEFCDAHKLSVRQRLELFIAVCQAVQHAHQKGVIHRDLKPSNVLVTEQDDVPQPKIIDFGIAKALGSDTRATIQTDIGQLVGTLAYESRAGAGRSRWISTRSDVYSLGVILYELLTGRLPTPSARSFMKPSIPFARRSPRGSAR
jgi:serine/threonine protein kinase